MPAQSTMAERLIGVVKLDIAIYKDVEHHETATARLAGVVELRRRTWRQAERPVSRS